MSHLTLIFWPTSLLLYTLCECLTNVASAGIQSCSQSNSISTCPARLQYFLTPVSSSSLVAFMSTLLIAHLYFQVRSIGLDAQTTSASAVVSAGPSDSFFSLAFSEIITSFIAIILVCRTLCCQICNLYSFLFILL